jgi:hypothetical protein
MEMSDLPKPTLRKLMFLRIAKGDAEQVQETLDWGADPNWYSKKGRPALVKAVRGYSIDVEVVKTLLNAGADPRATDELGLTALDHARRRLLKYEGKPRKTPKRSPSLSAGGELVLQEHEWEFIERMESEHPGFTDDYLEQRRKAAEKVFDPRSNLERIVALLESVQRSK